MCNLTSVAFYLLEKLYQTYDSRALVYLLLISNKILIEEKCNEWINVSLNFTLFGHLRYKTLASYT